MSCERCGRCCHEFGVYVQDDADIARLFSYHGFQAERRSDGLYLKGTNPCQHLRRGRGGVYECAIYIHRPKICRDFQCN